MKRQTIIIIIVAIALAGALAYGLIINRNQVRAGNSDFLTSQLEVGNLSAVVDETGEVRADQTAVLYWETTGIVESVNVQVGDAVEIDDVLAALDEESLPQTYYLAQQDLINATRALEDLYENAAEVAAQAQSAVAAARDSLDDAEYHWLLNQPGNRASEETHKAARAKVIIAEKQLESKQKNFNNAKGKVAKAQAQIVLTDAINNYQYAVWYENWLKEGADEIEMAILDANIAVALANLEAAEREYERVKDGPAQEDVQMAEARVAAAEASLSTISITAPFDGVITSVEPLTGDLVAPNTMAFRMDNLETLLVDVNVSEVDINQIEVGQPVILSFDAIQEREYQGEVSEVSLVGAQQQGLVTFGVSIKVLDPDEFVRPGLTAAVQIVVREVEGALLIPNRAVRWVNGEQVVYLASDPDNITAENLVRVPVVLGSSSDEYSELLEGDLKEGDVIVLNPPSVNIFEDAQPGDGPPSQFR